MVIFARLTDERSVQNVFLSVTMANMSTHKYGSKGNSLILGCEFVALTTLSQILGIWHHEVISSGNLTHSVKNSCDPNITHTMNYSWAFWGITELSCSMVREKFYTFYLSLFKYLVKYFRLINNRKAVLSLRVRLKYTTKHFKGVYSRETVALSLSS